MKDFVKKFDRDAKYYLAKPFKVDENKIRILDLYENFIDANNGFIEVDTTDKIKLVGNFDKLTQEEISEINSKIEEVINENKIEELLVFCDKM